MRSTHVGEEGLFDQLIGAGEQRGRHSQAKCFGGLEIDDQLKLRGLLDRQNGEPKNKNASLAGFLSFCARATPDQAAAPPANAMNFRRLIRSPPSLARSRALWSSVRRLQKKA
jgi:hypothetical protein